MQQHAGVCALAAVDCVCLFTGGGHQFFRGIPLVVQPGVAVLFVGDEIFELLPLFVGGAVFLDVCFPSGIFGLVEFGDPLFPVLFVQLGIELGKLAARTFIDAQSLQVAEENVLGVDAEGVAGAAAEDAADLGGGGGALVIDHGDTVADFIHGIFCQSHFRQFLVGELREFLQCVGFQLFAGGLHRGLVFHGGDSFGGGQLLGAGGEILEDGVFQSIKGDFRILGCQNLLYGFVQRLNAGGGNGIFGNLFLGEECREGEGYECEQENRFAHKWFCSLEVM